MICLETVQIRTVCNYYPHHKPTVIKAGELRCKGASIRCDKVKGTVFVQVYDKKI